MWLPENDEHYEDRKKLIQMSSVEKHQYFVQRNLLITTSANSYENIITTQLVLTADDFLADLKTKSESNLKHQ